MLDRGLQVWDSVGVLGRHLAMAKIGRKFELLTFRDHGVEVQVYVQTTSVNNHKGWFYANYGSETFENQDFSKVRKSIEDYLDRSNKLEWKPILEVSASYDESSTHWEGQEVKVSIETSRYYVAMKPNGQWVRCNFDDTEVERKRNQSDLNVWHGKNKIDLTSLPLSLEASHYRHSSIDHQSEKTHYLDYDEALWQGLESIKQQMHLLADRLKSMLDCAPGRKRIAEAGGVKLLALAEESGQ